MPCHIVKTESLFPDLKPVKPNFSIHELLGHAEKENPATFGIYTIERGEPVTFNKMPFHAFAVLIDGEAWLEDLDDQTGPITVRVGDLMHVTVGTSVRWGSDTKCKGIFVFLKPLGDPVFIQGLE